MKADITKDTFNVIKHFSRVLMQQGRVQLDADWNEQADILLHYIHTLAKDLIGEHAGPKDNAAFEITEVSDTDFKIGLGNYYVDGILCECEGEANSEGNREPYKYTHQPNFSIKDQLSKDKNGYLVYLDVWERLITYIEDKSVREVALSEADTAARAQIIWQVKVEYMKAEGKKIGDFSNAELKNLGVNINNVWPEWKKLWQPEKRGLLKSKAKLPFVQSEPCTISPQSGYFGMENQLYRVEIHKGGSDKPAFKWSRDNGPVVSRATLKGNELTLDNTQGFSSGKLVELTNKEQELRGESGILLKINKINKINKNVLCLDVDVTVLPPVGKHCPTKVRLWDSAAIEIVEGK